MGVDEKKQELKMAVDMSKFTNKWEAGLFGCMGDPGICCMGMFCGACLYGKTSEIVEDDCMKPAVLAACCGICTVCMWAPARRDTIRQTYELLHELVPLPRLRELSRGPTVEGEQRVQTQRMAR